MNIPKATYREKGLTVSLDDVNYILSILRTLSKRNNTSIGDMSLKEDNIANSLRLAKVYHCDQIKYSLSELSNYLLGKDLNPESIDNSLYYYDWDQCEKIAKIIIEISNKFNIEESSVLYSLIKNNMIDLMFSDDFSEDIEFEKYINKLHESIS